MAKIIFLQIVLYVVACNVLDGHPSETCPKKPNKIEELVPKKVRNELLVITIQLRLYISTNIRFLTVMSDDFFG